jgi:hypothetical protein
MRFMTRAMMRATIHTTAALQHPSTSDRTIWSCWRIPRTTAPPALVKRLVHLGRDVHLELQLANGHQLHAQLPREWVLKHREGLNHGSRLYLRPRSVRTFS